MPLEKSKEIQRQEGRTETAGQTGGGAMIDPEHPSSVAPQILEAARAWRDSGEDDLRDLCDFVIQRAAAEALSLCKRPPLAEGMANEQKAGEGGKPLVYLASPYSHPERSVRAQRFEAVCRAAAKLMNGGVYLYSAISHSHPIAEAGSLPLGWDFWGAYDRAILSCCNKVIVLRLDGWRESKGVQAEIAIAAEQGIPVEYIDEEPPPPGSTDADPTAGPLHTVGKDDPCAPLGSEPEDEHLGYREKEALKAHWQEHELNGIRRDLEAAGYPVGSITHDDAGKMVTEQMTLGAHILFALDDMKQAKEAAERQLKDVERDARRYRHWRVHPFMMEQVIWSVSSELDAAIDAAIDRQGTET